MGVKGLCRDFDEINTRSYERTDTRSVGVNVHCEAMSGVRDFNTTSCFCSVGVFTSSESSLSSRVKNDSWLCAAVLGPDTRTQFVDVLVFSWLSIQALVLCFFLPLTFSFFPFSSLFPGPIAPLRLLV